MRPEPRSPYAITKLDGEYYLEMFQRSGRLQTASIRFFNVFGPRQDPQGAYAAAVPIFLMKALKNEDITIFGDGQQTRSFCFGFVKITTSNCGVRQHSDLPWLYF
jgi:UDP-glucose 4-epimerase